MSVRRPAPKSEQPENFEFTKDNLSLAKSHIAKYPVGRQASAVLPLLDLAQRQHNNWVPMAAVDYIANMLDMPAIHVFEVVTFYTMFNLQPRGKHLIQLCRTTPCWLKGCDDFLKVCKEKLGIAPGGTTQDGLFTLMEVECLGACANAPVVQINDDYYEDLDPSSFEKILTLLEKEKKPISGSLKGRQSSKACLASLSQKTERKEP
jgi:NADH-quinone oxidoreductase subunit E